MEATKLADFKSFFLGKSFNYSFICDDIREVRLVSVINNIKGNKMLGCKVLWYNGGFVLLTDNMMNSLMINGEYRDDNYTITMA